VLDLIGNFVSGKQEHLFLGWANDEQLLTAILIGNRTARISCFNFSTLVLHRMGIIRVNAKIGLPDECYHSPVQHSKLLVSIQRKLGFPGYAQ